MPLTPKGGGGGGGGGGREGERREGGKMGIGKRRMRGREKGEMWRRGGGGGGGGAAIQNQTREEDKCFTDCEHPEMPSELFGVPAKDAHSVNHIPSQGSCGVKLFSWEFEFPVLGTSAGSWWQKAGLMCNHRPQCDLGVNWIDSV